MTDPWLDRLSEYLDDDEELTASERAQIEAHLRTCETCATALDELRLIKASALDLQDTVPAHDLWEGIAARLTPNESTIKRRFTFSLPQLAAAAAVLIALSAGSVWWLASRRHDPRTTVSSAPTADAPVPLRAANFADPEYDAAVADLEQALRDGRGSLDPKTIEILERNLHVIDQAIDQARQALDEDPSNSYLNGHLADARRRKLALLRRATVLAGPVS